METLLPVDVIAALEGHLTTLSRQEDTEKKEYRGFIFPPPFQPETARYAMEEWDIPEKTVFVAAYPKAGNHWPTDVANSILSLRDERARYLLANVPHLPFFLAESGSKDRYKMFEYLKLPRLVISTHLCEELFDFEKVKQKKGKVIYLIRNPKDRLLSYYHFSKTLSRSLALEDMTTIDWNGFFDNAMKGKYSYMLRKGENYLDHIVGWLKHKHDKDFLLLVYEDMKKNLKKEIARIADFLQVQLTDEETNSVANACTFNNIKKKTEEEKGRAATNYMKIMRKGEVGGWKEYFTVAQSEQMDKQIEEKLGQTGIKFIYEL